MALYGGDMKEKPDDKMITVMHIECERSQIGYVEVLEHLVIRLLARHHDPYNDVLSYTREAEVLRVDTDGSKLYKE